MDMMVVDCYQVVAAGMRVHRHTYRTALLMHIVTRKMHKHLGALYSHQK